MTRRDYGDGAISERKNKNNVVTGYQARIRLPDGRRSFTAKTEREAKKWLREARAEAARGTLAAKRPPTFAAYLSQWLDGMADKVKPRTFAAYRLNVQRVPDSLGALRLDELRPQHFKVFYQDLSAGLAPRTVRQVHMTLHKALADAMTELQVIGRNPTQGVKLPRVPQTEMHWYTDDQLARLFESTEGDSFHALWLVLGTLGLRLGEALGLKWSDIDWDRRTLTVRRSLQRNRLTGTLELTETKTKGSRRTLTMPAGTARALKAHQDRQDFTRKNARDVWQDHKLVFCTGLGTPLEQGRIHHHWRKATAKAGIPRYRPHDLRHSVPSNLIAGGMGLLEVAHLLGHQNAAMVMQVYGHLAPDDHKRAAALMEAMLTRHSSANS